jgi:hypothetical protein
VISALHGTNYRGENELGTLQILGSQGIGRIILKKSKLNLLSPGWLPLSKVSSSPFPKGLESMEEDYSISPERRFGEYVPFHCSGTIKKTDSDGNFQKTEIEIQVTQHADAATARKFINAFLSNVPTTQRIVSQSSVATVLDRGTQKVVVDRDVERVAGTRFTNTSPSFYYYLTVLFILVIVGLIGYLRWAQKLS